MQATQQDQMVSSRHHLFSHNISNIYLSIQYLGTVGDREGYVLASYVT